jgi:hypothetical protein
MTPLLFETTADPPTVDSFLSALASEPRRLVLAYFENESENEETASLDGLAEHVAATRNRATLEHTRIHLYHVHLPKLEAVGLVDHDTETQTVRYRGTPAEVDVRAGHDNSLGGGRQ